MCFIPLALVNCLNSSLAKYGPLSVTIFLGSPCVAKTRRSCSMVFPAVMDFIMIASNHFE